MYYSLLHQQPRLKLRKLCPPVYNQLRRVYHRHHFRSIPITEGEHIVENLSLLPMGLHPTGNRVLFRRCTLIGSLRFGRPSCLLGSSGILAKPSKVLPGTGNCLRDPDEPGHDSLRQLVSNALANRV